MSIRASHIPVAGASLALVQMLVSYGRRKKELILLALGSV